MDRERLAQHRLRNALQSLLLVAGLAGICGWLAWLIGGPLLAWMTLAFVVSAYALNPAASPRLVMGMYRARPLAPYDAPRLHALLDALAERAGLDRAPRLYYLPTRLMNAFATGTREDAAIALSDGLLRRMDLREIAGVLAHELSHVAREDIRVLAFADLAGRVTGFLSLFGQILLMVNLPLILFSDYAIDWLPILVLLAAPTLSALVQLALSRSREYEADRAAAELTGDPEGLASALRAMESYQGRVLEHILMPGQRLPVPELLRTHPPTAERVRRLLELRERRPPRLPLDWERDRAIPLHPFHGRELGRPRWHRYGIWY